MRNLIFSFYYHSSWWRGCSSSPSNFPFPRYQCYAMEYAQGRLSPATLPPVPRGDKNRIWKWQTQKPWTFAFLLWWVSPSPAWPCSITQITPELVRAACCHLGPSQVPLRAQSQTVTKNFCNTGVRETQNERFVCNLKYKSTCWPSKRMESRLAVVLSAENNWQISQRLNRKYCLLF